jgi:heme exporter protein A
VIFMTSQVLLSVSGFTYTKGGRTLFQNLSFTLLAGEVLILMGPNGSGKTTLLRCLADIPKSFVCITKAQDLNQSYVGHLNALKAGLTVRQNLLNQIETTSEKVTSALAVRGLTSFADREIRTLSAGQQRQIALTRLSLSDAKLWLADEPTTHLDETATAQFWGTLDAHLKGGGAAVVSTHAPIPLSNAKIVRLHG